LAKKKSNAELQAENRLLRRGNAASGTSNVLVNLIRWGAVVLSFRYLYLTVDSLAGQVTLAQIGINFLGNLTVSQSLAYIFGAGGVVYGYGERKLRQRTIRRLGPKRKELEVSIDPKRTSSKLTDKGETNPDDAT
jgi:hypothetical protein